MSAVSMLMSEKEESCDGIVHYRGYLDAGEMRFGYSRCVVTL